MSHGGNNRQRFVDTPELVVRLCDVTERFTAPEFQQLREFLLKRESPEPEPVILPPPSAPPPLPPLPPLVAAASTEQPRAWYQDCVLLLKEKAALSKLLAAVPECPGLFYRRDGSERIGAVGLLTTTTGTTVRLESVYPEDYPHSPPQVFFCGSGLEKLAHLLRVDGSVPVPFGPNQTWDASLNGGHLLVWAIDWLEQVAAVAPASRVGA